MPARAAPRRQRRVGGPSAEVVDHSASGTRGTRGPDTVRATADDGEREPTDPEAAGRFPVPDQDEDGEEDADEEAD